MVNSLDYAETEVLLQISSLKLFPAQGLPYIIYLFCLLEGPEVYTQREGLLVKKTKVDRQLHSDTRKPPSCLINLQVFSTVATVHDLLTLTENYFTPPCTVKQYSIKSFIHCSSTHIVYMLKYPYALVHVGQTHISQIHISESEKV